MAHPDRDRLAVGSWSWHAAYYAGRWSLLDLPSAAAALGIPWVECNDFMLPPPRLSRVRRPLLALLPGAPPELWRYSRATLRRLAVAAGAAGVAVLAWTVNSDFAVPAQAWPAQRLYLARGQAAAGLLGAPLLRLTLGGAADSPAGHDALVIRRLTDFTGQALERRPGLAVTVENHWGISADIVRHLRIVDAAAAGLPDGLRRRFGCCFDPGNVPEVPERERLWRELALRANHFHLKAEALDERGEERSLPIGRLFEMLRASGYRGKVTIEYAGSGPAEDGVAACAELFGRYGSAA
jgi:sugar phosphate isomerase/epimerase